MQILHKLFQCARHEDDRMELSFFASDSDVCWLEIWMNKTGSLVALSEESVQELILQLNTVLKVMAERD